MNVINPMTITDAMIVSSNCYETAPATYAAGTTYALDAYASVAGLLGEILIYRSLQAGNLNKTPSSSPTWWVYSSSTYGVYNPLTTYPLGQRVIDTARHRVKESLRAGNANRSTDNTPAWKHIGEINYPIATPFHSSATTYALDALVIGWINSGVDFIDHNIYGLMRSKAAGNLGNSTDQTPPGPTIPPTPYTGNSWWAIMEYVYPKFNIFAVYSKGEKVTDTDGKIYECQISDTNRQPLTNAVQWWQDVAPSNRAAMFDNIRTYPSIANKSMKFTIAPSAVVESAALIGAKADYALITCRDGLGGAIVYQKSVGLAGESIVNYTTFFFADPLVNRTKEVFDGLPPIYNIHIEIELVGSGEVRLSNYLIGKSRSLGLAEYGVNNEIVDLSGRLRDVFGELTLVPRGYYDKLSVRTMMDKSEQNRIKNLLQSVRGKPCVWFVADDPAYSEMLIFYGIYDKVSIDIPYDAKSFCSINLEGLTYDNN